MKLIVCIVSNGNNIRNCPTFRIFITIPNDV